MIVWTILPLCTFMVAASRCNSEPDSLGLHPSSQQEVKYWLHHTLTCVAGQLQRTSSRQSEQIALLQCCLQMNAITCLFCLGAGDLCTLQETKTHYFAPEIDGSNQPNPFENSFWQWNIA